MPARNKSVRRRSRSGSRKMSMKNRPNNNNQPKKSRRGKSGKGRKGHSRKNKKERVGSWTQIKGIWTNKSKLNRPNLNASVNSGNDNTVQQPIEGEMKGPFYNHERKINASYYTHRMNNPKLSNTYQANNANRKKTNRRKAANGLLNSSQSTYFQGNRVRPTKVQDIHSKFGMTRRCNINKTDKTFMSKTLVSIDSILEKIINAHINFKKDKPPAIKYSQLNRDKNSIRKDLSEIKPRLAKLIDLYNECGNTKTFTYTSDEYEISVNLDDLIRADDISIKNYIEHLN